MSSVNRMAYLDKNHTFTIKEEPIPMPGQGEVCVRVMANGICGSDLHFFHDGRLGNFVVTRPYVPGHEASGYIHAIGGGVGDWADGDPVVIEPGIPCGHCAYCRRGRYNLCKTVRFLSAPPENGTFCDYLAIRADSVHAMPKGTTYEQGAMVEPAAVAVHAVNRGRVRNGDSAVVLGCGPIGLMTLQAFKAAGGVRATCIDQVPYRLQLAKQLGADEIATPDNVPAAVSASADIVFETAGSSRATARLFDFVRPGGRVVQVGWPEVNEVALNVADFIEKELDYIAVNRYANAFEAAIGWIAEGRIRTEEMITDRFSLDQISRAFSFALEKKNEAIKVVVLSEM